MVLALAVIGIVVVTVLVIVLAGGGGGEPAPGPRAAAPPSDPPPRSDEVQRLLDDMDVERKVAQLMLVGFEGTDAGAKVFDDLEDRDYAGLVIEDRNYSSTGGVEEVADEAVAVARRADHTPPWVMAPQDGGEFNAIADAPPDQEPSELESAEEVAEASREAGEELLDLGLNGVLAPTLDVAVEGAVGAEAAEGVGGVGETAYSDLPGVVTEYAAAAVEALDDAGIFAAPKHFPGLGGASQPTERGPASVGLSLEELAGRDLRPFRAAIDAGAPGIVIGPGLYAVDDFVTPAMASPTIVTDLLRRDLGFEGLAIADDVTSPAVTATLPAPDASVAAVQAGSDLVYVSRQEDEQRAVREALLAAVEDGEISEERLDEAVRRNLAAKEEAGVLPSGEERGDGGSGGGDGGSGGGDGGSGGGGGGSRGGRSAGGDGTGGGENGPAADPPFRPRVGP